ncbi:MAG: hypothetical protein ACK4SA_24005, partial [Caldilinea sp.]
MRTFDDIRKAHLAGPTVMTIGNFDGIHCGHQALLRHMQQVADALATTQSLSVNTLLLTFEPHPVRVLRPDLPYFLLTTPMERLELAAMLGVTHGVIHPFTLETAQIEPQSFMQMLKQHLGLSVLIVGPDFALGRNRSGDLPTLRAIGETLDFRVEVIDPIAQDAETVRSSRVRSLLSEGDVARVAALLGRPYRVTGVVEHGEAARQPDQRRAVPHTVELVGRAIDLRCGVGALVLGGVGPEHGGQGAVALGVVAGGQVERAGELDAVGALVGDQLLLDVGELRHGVAEARELARARAVEQEVVGRLG